MKSLEKAVQASGTDGPAATEQLTRIYIGLGVELQKQIAALREAGRAPTGGANRGSIRPVPRPHRGAPERGELADARLAGANLLRTRQRAASRAVHGPGQLRQINNQSPPAGPARDYLVKARDAYQKLLEAGAKNPKLPPSETAMLAARVQLGECQRALGQYQQALDTFSAVLKEKESSLAVQRAAAYAYQERGQAEDAKWLERAIHGGYRLKSTGQNRIWGWLKISQVAVRAARADAKYRDTFYEARLNVARCRYLAAMKQSGAGTPTRPGQGEAKHPIVRAAVSRAGRRALARRV